MGLMSFLKNLFAGNRNVITETVEVFRENADKSDQRSADYSMAVQRQFAEEFHAPQKSGFDSFVDAMNRLPRPALAFGVIFLFVAAMTDPVWFAARMVGVSLIPEPLWWLLGVIVSFYFGARHQAKSQEFRKMMTTTAETLPQQAADAVQKIREITRHEYDPTDSVNEEGFPEISKETKNAAIVEWRKGGTQ